MRASADRLGAGAAGWAQQALVPQGKGRCAGAASKCGGHGSHLKNLRSGFHWRRAIRKKVLSSTRPSMQVYLSGCVVGGVSEWEKVSARGGAWS